MSKILTSDFCKHKLSLSKSATAITIKSLINVRGKVWIDNWSFSIDHGDQIYLSLDEKSYTFSVNYFIIILLYDLPNLSIANKKFIEIHSTWFDLGSRFPKFYTLWTYQSRKFLSLTGSIDTTLELDFSSINVCEMASC